jgi:hypothetical protein
LKIGSKLLKGERGPRGRGIRYASPPSWIFASSLILKQVLCSQRHDKLVYSGALIKYNSVLNSFGFEFLYFLLLAMRNKVHSLLFFLINLESRLFQNKEPGQCPKIRPSYGKKSILVITKKVKVLTEKI